MAAAGVAALSTAFAGELMLQIAARLSPRIQATLFPNQALDFLVPDPELGARGNPRLPEHDQNGFRNAAVLSQADIVAIGDSQTYGMGTAAQDTWVRLLARRTSCKVYSMALGGYGPLQYELLAKSALSLKPRLLIVGIYFGNDFFDNWEMYRRHPTNYPVPENLKTAAMQREARMPLVREVPDLFSVQPQDRTDEPSWSIQYFLSQNLALWGLMRAAKNELLSPPIAPSPLAPDFRTSVAALTATQLQYTSSFEGNDWKTILTARYRLLAEDDSDPRIQVGLWLTRWAVQAIERAAHQQGIRTLFLLAPTKEKVFANKVERRSDHPFLEALVAAEDRDRANLVGFMESEKIAYLDLLPALGASSSQPYPANVDGHPNAAGHRAIADTLDGTVTACIH